MHASQPGQYANTDLRHRQAEKAKADAMHARGSGLEMSLESLDLEAEPVAMGKACKAKPGKNSDDKVVLAWPLHAGEDTMVRLP